MDTTRCARCGRTIPTAVAMAANFGTACPDCYDALSEAPARTILAELPREVDLAADGTMTVVLRFEDEQAREVVKRAGLRWNPDLNIWRARFVDRQVALATAARLIALGVPAEDGLSREVASESGRTLSFRIACKWAGTRYESFPAFVAEIPTGAPVARSFEAEVRAAWTRIRRAVADAVGGGEVKRGDPSDLRISGETARGTVETRVNRAMTLCSFTIAPVGAEEA